MANIYCFEVHVYVRTRMYCVFVRTRIYCVVVRTRVYCIFVRTRMYCVFVRTRIYCVFHFPKQQKLNWLGEYRTNIIKNTHQELKATFLWDFENSSVGFCQPFLLRYSNSTPLLNMFASCAVTFFSRIGFTTFSRVKAHI